MHIVCVGISHRTASVELREKVAMNAEQATGMLRELHGLFPSAELAAISTCNRTEFFVARPLHGHPRAEEVASFLSSTRQIEASELAPALYHHENEKAVRHLMRVAAGLDSMVLGENQIVAQVKQAYEWAQQAGTAGPVMHRMFQSAIAAAKRVRTETGIGAGRTSVSSVAVDFARHVFRSFDDKTVLTIGAGKMTELTLQYFMELRPRKLLVCNRTLKKAEELAAKAGGEAVLFEQLDEHMVAADVVISSTGSTSAIVTAERFKPLIKRRRFRPILIIDIAMPRDFDPAVGQLSGVYLYDLDDLQRAIADQAAARSGQVTAAEAILEPAVAECYAAVQTGDFKEIIQKLRAHLHEIGVMEKQRTLNKLKAAPATDHERILEEHTERLINKILHRPMSELGRNRTVPAAMYATALRRLFDLGEGMEEDMERPEPNDPGEA